MIKVGVLGSGGRMGAAVCETIAGAAGVELAARVDQGDSLDALIGCDVVVDFTHVGVVLDNLRWCVGHGLNIVVGTSGFGVERLAQVRAWLAGRVRPGAHRAELLGRRGADDAVRRAGGPLLRLGRGHRAASREQDRRAVGDGAADGGADRRGRAKAGLGAPPDATKEELPGARGASVDDVRVHSVRLAGLVAHQEVLFGGHGETLTIRHDSLDRASFMPGVLIAVRGVATLPAGLTVGIEPLLGLD